jgi:hypothetical protein
MNLLTYTTYEDVRAALGVSDDELEDVTLALTTYYDNLVSEFEDISYDLQTTLDEMLERVEPVPPPDPPEPLYSTVEIRFMRNARLFSTYATAKNLCGSLPMFGQKSITDGKAKLDRFNDPYAETCKDINAAYDKWRAKLVASFNEIGQSANTSTVRIYFGVMTPVSDPVVGT